MNDLLFQAVKGLRRQFLMTPEANIIVLLKRGEKVDSCNNVFRDVTEHMKCKVSVTPTLTNEIWLIYYYYTYYISYQQVKCKGMTS